MLQIARSPRHALLRVHAAKITLLDRQVRRLLNELHEVGRLDNTLVLFSSDNGPHFAPHGHDMNRAFESARTEATGFP